ncbi:MAG: DUF3298 and DUF4163 domain-containing protein [Thiothrix sp.]|nr:DUF3298 and DUF4163 domain-containing protein [Thiothrix sp.]
MSIMSVRILLVGLMLSSVSACSESDSATPKSNPYDLGFVAQELVREGGSNCLDPQAAQKQDGASGQADAGGSHDELCARVTFSWPEIRSASSPELALKLNQYIQNALQNSFEDEVSTTPATVQGLEAYANGFIENYKQDGNAFSSWMLERRMEIIFTTEQLISFALSEDGYTGGAHPFSGVNYSVINLQTGTPVSLADLLNPGFEAPLNVAGEKVFRRVRDIPDSESLDEQGFSFENSVFALNDNFAVLKEGLRFRFNSYEVAAYAMGPTELLLPYEDIQALIRPDGPLGHAE